MAARFSSMTTASNCCFATAACASAHLTPILDTARMLVVSICICLVPLRICGQTA